jgi:tetratricopeptide (TPR) repeat protein
VALSLVGQYEQAIKQLQEVLKMDSNFPPALWALGHAYFLQEKYEEAITWFQKAFASSGEHSFWLGPLGLAYAESGRKEKAVEILVKMKKFYDNRQNISMTWIAAIHEVLGEKDQAFEWLERAIEEQDVQAPWYKNYNMFKSMRSDPRFKTIVKKMNLE